MKRAIFYTNDMEGHQPTWGHAFVEGIRRHGWSADVSNHVESCDLFVMWGARRTELMDRARRKGAEICVLERAYLPDRFQWLSVSFGGGLNGRGKFNGPFSDGSRWEKNFGHMMQPWQPKSDGYALIMEQIQTDTSVRGVDMPRFYAKAGDAFAAIGLPVKVRPHPHCTPKSGQSVIAESYKSLADDLADARCAVTWNSNSGVDAVLAGVPTIAMDEGSMAWDVTGHELKLPPMPDRLPWAHALAWKQWAKDELASGFCWENVRGDL